MSNKFKNIFDMKENYRKILAVLLLGVLPFFSFYMFETIAGNFRTIMENTKGIILLNVMMWYLLYGMVFMLTNHVKYTIWILNTVIYIYAVVNAFVVQFRSQPIMIMDFKSISTAVSVAGEYTYTFSGEMKWLGVVMLMIHLAVWAWNIDFSWKKWQVRFLYAVVSVGLTLFSINGMLKGDWLEKAGLYNMSFFRFNLTYQTSGYMLCTMKTIQYLDVAAPEGYTVESVLEIADRKKEEEDKESEKSEEELPENIIVIMNESFADLSVLGELHTEQPILENFYNMEGNVTRGKVYVSAYGGATANSEFEFLTGNSIAYIPAGTVPYQMYVDESDSSIVSVLKQNGYRTIALHPFRKDNYNRPNVYKWYGFDEYYGKDDVETKKLRKYASDKSNYKALIELYQDKAPGEKLFTFNITIQNHAGYDSEKFKYPIALTDCPGQFPQAEQYLGLMKKSDEALQYLIDYFSKVDEKTVILLFGDHQPSLEEDFYEYVMSESTSETWFRDSMNKHITPYLLWANYELDMKEIEYISTNFLGTYLLDTIGIELPVYNQYLLELQEQVPAMNYMGYIDKQNVLHGYGEMTQEEERLKEYRIFQYNNIFDDRNRIDELYE